SGARHDRHDRGANQHMRPVVWAPWGLELGDARGEGHRTGTGAGRVIVEMRTVTQAGRVAASTGGEQLAGKADCSDARRLSRRVEVGPNFEAHRSAVEAVSVLFKLFDDTDGELVEVPSGWTVTAAKFEVEWPTERDRSALVRSHFGARRFAFNWGLAR